MKIIDNALCECGHTIRMHGGHWQKPESSWCAAPASGERAAPFLFTCNCVAFTLAKVQLDADELQAQADERAEAAWRANNPS